MSPYDSPITPVNEVTMLEYNVQLYNYVNVTMYVWNHGLVCKTIRVNALGWGRLFYNHCRTALGGFFFSMKVS